MSQVALFTRAWIEMAIVLLYSVIKVSPSSRGRGLKLPRIIAVFTVDEVALFTRAWIEIHAWRIYAISPFVALFTRAWIEISNQRGRAEALRCRPLHEGVD